MNYLLGLILVFSSWGLGWYLDSSNIMESNAYFWALGSIPAMISGFIWGYCD